jgi:hypothetical protein
MQSPAKWIKLNEKKLLADCIAALQPDDSFVKKMVEEAKKLKESSKVSSDEFLAVSRSYLIQEMLMKETLGDPDEVSGDNIEEVLKKIRADAAYIPEQQLQAEKVKNQEIETQLLNYERDSIEKRVRLMQAIRRIVTYIMNIVFVSCMILLTVSIVIPFLGNVSLIWKIASAISAIFFGIFSVGYGANLKGWKGGLIDKISEKIGSFLEKGLLSLVLNVEKK